MGLQRGKYIAIEDDIKKLKTQHDIGKMKTQEDLKSEIKPQKSGPKSKLVNNDLSLNLRYCLASDVGKKRNDFLIYKAVFLQKIGNLKHNGQRQDLLHNLCAWIEKEGDFLYQNA